MSVSWISQKFIKATYYMPYLVYCGTSQVFFKWVVDVLLGLLVEYI